MMKVILDNVAKRFGREWIFKNFNQQFSSGTSYAVVGNNGSGKSTLIRILAGYLTPSKGQRSFQLSDQEIPIEKAYQYVTMCAPYVELINEFTLKELLQFHFQFKKPIQGLSTQDCIEIMQLGRAKNKELQNFSSGMKQRVKLGLAVLSDCPILLLDEPSSNLDEEGFEWYEQLLEKYTSSRLLVVASNQKQEYANCTEVISIMDYKS